MNVVLAAAGALALTATLVGCGDTSRPAVEPDAAGRPGWGGCSEFAYQAMSIAKRARGAHTLEGAVADYRESGDRVVMVPARGGLPHRWIVRGDGTIRVDLEVGHSPSGWFVTGTKRCSAPDE